MNPLCCNYYLTLRCNDQCQFCPIWEKYEDQEIEESSPETVINNLEALKKIGVAYLDITGGEPLLYKELPRILRAAKTLKLFTVLTTNGILYKERAGELKGLADRLIFSLDYPIKEEHDESRGTEIFDDVIGAIQLAKKLGGHPIINFTLTRNSVGYLPEMAELAEKLGVFLWLNPVNDFARTQGFSWDSLLHINYFNRKKHVAMNNAMLNFIKAGGNRISAPRCRASNSTITIMPDDTLVFPCFHAQELSLKIDGNLLELYRTHPFFKRGERLQGRTDKCSSCMASNYMIPSFLYKFDKYLLGNLVSLGRFLYKEYKYVKKPG